MKFLNGRTETLHNIITKTSIAATTDETTITGIFLGRDYQSTHTYSEAIATKIDAAVTKLVETAHKDAVKKRTSAHAHGKVCFELADSHVVVVVFGTGHCVARRLTARYYGYFVHGVAHRL